MTILYRGEEIVKLYIKLMDRINKMALSFIGVLLIIMVFSITYQVLVRNLFPKLGFEVSASWAGELPLYCMIWLVFLGAAVAVRDNKLISVDFIQTYLPPKWENIVIITTIILSMTFFVSLLISGYHWAIFGLSQRSVSMPISMFLVYLSLPISVILMLANSIAYLLDEFLMKKIKKSEI